MELMGYVSVFRHVSLVQHIYQWESGRCQSEASAVASRAMSIPASAGYFSVDACQKPTDTELSLKRVVSLDSQ